MSTLRPLPPRPTLAFERKTAKALLRRLRAGDLEAVARARACHPTIDLTAPDRVRLADAQLVIAREYGFASWPRLVRYFGDLERQAHAHQSTHSSEVYESVARSLIAEHGQRRGVAGRAFAAYVPRLYGKSLDEVFAAEVSEAEARLATARMYGFQSWEMLRERAAAASSRRSSDLKVDPMWAANQAIAAADLDALRRIVEDHPELLDPTDEDEAVGRTLLSVTIRKGQRLGVAAVLPTLEWLAAQGLDLQRALNLELCVPKEMMQPERVRYLLDCGADPNWVAPSGIPVLEHALLRWFSGDAVDVLAAHAKPRRALWIAAGLGDIDGVRRFLDSEGRPRRAARRLRPDFVAVGRTGMTFHPDPDDEEILLEAFVVAMFNGRTAVLEYMAGQGFDVNTRLWDTPVLNLAVGGEWPRVVECLLRLGANPDLEGWQPHMSARQIARELFDQNPRIAKRRRIVELCEKAF
jgi:hypothetical protein